MTPTGRASDNVDAVFDTLPAAFWPILVHECGHVIAANRLGLFVKRLEVTIDGDRVDGYSVVSDQTRLSNYLTVLLAGEQSEAEVFGRPMIDRMHTDDGDRHQLWLAVVRAGPQGERELFIARQKVKRLVHTHKSFIVGLASELMAIATWAGVMVEGQQLAALLDVDGAGILRRTAV